MIEEWKDVIGYENYYSISNLGRFKRKNITYYRKTDGIKCTLSEKIVTPTIWNKGYPRVILECFGQAKSKSIFIHVLVAKHFIPNPNNYSQVNHIDGNKTNNKVDNLEWVSNKQNVLHSYRDEHMIHSNAIAVYQKDKNGNIINKFQTIRQAEEITGFSRKYISKAIKNRREYKGYYWSVWDRKLEMEESINE